jgi:hypothetical protein
MSGTLNWNVSDGARRWWRFVGLAGGLLAVSLPAAESPAPTTTAAVSPRPLPDGPRIQFVELTHDFGQIKHGETAAHTFVFTNTGNAMLEIRDVQLSCGCTTVGAWDRQVAPGQTGRIPIQLATATLSGPVVRTISVSCNDPLQPSTVLRISVTVWAPVEVTPSIVILQFTTESKNSETQTVRILNHLPEPLSVEEPRSTNAVFQAELRVVKPGQEFELRISAAPPPGGDDVAGVISVKTSSPEMPSVSVQARAMTRPDLVLSPTQIVLPEAPLAAGVNPSITILGMASNLLVLSEPKLSLPGLEVQLRELQPGRLFSLSVAFPAGFELPKNEAAEVTLKSNYPKYAVIRIPITQSGQPKR